jgi:hypothetical protein
MRPFCLTFTYVASIHREGQSPSSGRARNAFTFSSISAHSRLTWLLEIRLVMMARLASDLLRRTIPLAGT